MRPFKIVSLNENANLAHISSTGMHIFIYTWILDLLLNQCEKHVKTRHSSMKSTGKKVLAAGLQRHAMKVRGRSFAKGEKVQNQL